MKIIISFIAFLVMLLSVGSTLSVLVANDDVTCCGGACVESESDTKSKEDSDCCASLCNPFESCCCSIGYQVVASIQLFIHSHSIHIQPQLEIHKLTAGFVSRCWQPPALS